MDDDGADVVGGEDGAPMKKPALISLLTVGF